jgi:hypothetical protein
LSGLIVRTNSEVSLYRDDHTHTEQTIREWRSDSSTYSDRDRLAADHQVADCTCTEFGSSLHTFARHVMQNVQPCHRMWWRKNMTNWRALAVRLKIIQNSRQFPFDWPAIPDWRALVQFHLMYKSMCRCLTSFYFSPASRPCAACPNQEKKAQNSVHTSDILYVNLLTSSDSPSALETRHGGRG